MSHDYTMTDEERRQRVDRTPRWLGYDSRTECEACELKAYDHCAVCSSRPAPEEKPKP